MKILLFILIGVTIWYNVETKEGFVTNNDSTDNATIITIPSLGKVEYLTIEPKFTEKIGDFLERLDKNQSGLPNPIAIIKPVEKTGIKY